VRAPLSKKLETHWLSQPNITRRWALVAVTIWVSLVTFVSVSPLGHYLESRLAHPIDFRLREWLGQTPDIDPRLKIYVMDDKSVAENESWVLSIETWRDVLAGIAAKKPRAIFIDAMFGFVPSSSETSRKSAVDAIAVIETPIITGAFVSDARIATRDLLSLDRPEFRLEPLLAQSSVPGRTADDRLREHAPQLVDMSRGFAYGPMRDLTKAFSLQGHINYAGDNRVAPWIKLAGDVVLPHMTTWFSQRREFSRGRFLADDVVVPVDRDGHVLVNFIPESKWLSEARRMGPLIAKVADGEEITSVEPGDTVLVLPLMYTGHTDFSSSPFGSMAGGWILAAMLNSYLRGDFLTPLAHGWVLILLAALAAMLLASSLGTRAFFVSSAASTVMVMMGVAWLFSWFGIVVSWIFPLAAFWLTGVTVFAQKSRVAERKATALRLALEGAVAPAELRTILRHPELVRLEARERVVTLMFIDVVGFSVVAENMLPRLAFDNLKRILSNLAETIHAHGGIIDKSLGDGLLCYFGYSFDSDVASPDHAEKALRCAIRIQQDNIRRILDAAAAREAIYPLRIGINTASCYLGDLGTNQRIDFTVVGNGVNFAKRLEGACEMHSVLFGATTRDLVSGIGLDPNAIHRRLIRIKHHSELVEAFEFDPFHDKKELRDAATNAFRQSAQVERHEQRWPVNDASRIDIATEFGPAELVNFSFGGLSIKLPEFLAPGTSLRVELNTRRADLQDQLRASGLEFLSCEVRWGYAAAGGFVHGVVVLGVDRIRSEALVRVITEAAFGTEEAVS
jgi:class 3 adenylate cyclase